MAPDWLKVSIGQCSDRGRKPENQDFYGVLVPEPPLLATKGIAIALADGISTSKVAAVAAECAVKAFLDDYYCTSATWSVKTAATRVINATNAWLHVQTRHGHREHDPDRGHVCTFDALVLHSTTAHIFHIGDARIHRLAGPTLEQLTEDHRVVASAEQSYLGRALGVNHDVEIDYHTHPIAPGDVFILTTDGVHAHLDPPAIARAIHAHAADLDAAAAQVVAQAQAAGSPDNLTVQIIRVEQTPAALASEAQDQARGLKLPPALSPGMVLDGYRIVRPLHASHRSHVHLAVDTETGALAALKTPSTDLSGDAAHLRRMMMEEWVARRLDSPHVLRAPPILRARQFLYVVTEYIEGPTLAQWMRDHPRPDLETVRGIIEQVALGLRAFHRKDMLHQDLRPENIIIDKTGTARIIDFGSVRVGGVSDSLLHVDAGAMLGTLQYAAPEYFIGEPGTRRSDRFSLGVIAYHMLTGALPYGADIAKARTRRAQRRLVYRPACLANDDLPSWVDGALQKAVRIDPADRYDALSEFLTDLRHPNDAFVTGNRGLLQRDPLRFWKLATLLLAVIALALLYRLASA